MRRTATYTAWIIGLILSLAGLALIYSASRRIYGTELFWRQMTWLALGIFLAWLISRFDRHQIYRVSWFLYGLGILLLGITLLFGITVRGDRSWLDLGLFQLQASEPMKFFLVLAWARLGGIASRGDHSRLQTLIYSLAVFLAPLVLVLLQPDLGTALVYLAMFGGWLFVAGFWKEGFFYLCSFAAGVAGIFAVVREGFGQRVFLHEWLNGLQAGYPHLLLVIYALLVVTIILASYLISKQLRFGAAVACVFLVFLIGMQLVPALEEYQLQRLKVYSNPYTAPLESGYNIIQAQIAIGSGGWLGQGYLEGSQSQLGFIPELWTDFIFSVAVEELGLLFGFGLLITLGVYVYCFFSISSLSADWESYYISAGMALIVLVHVVFNTGVCVGLIPVVGLPLPFLSYGGSFLVTNWVLLGVLSVVSRRLTGQALLKSPPASDRVRRSPVDVPA